MSKVKPVPEGMHTLTPHLVVKNAAKAIDFYKAAFGAKENARFAGPNGLIMHASIKIGDSTMFLNDEFPEMGALSPQSMGGTAVTLTLYVEDSDQVFKKAVSAGAKVKMPIADQFWGDHYGCVEDPFGHSWAITSRKEDLTPAEMEKRGKEAMAQMSQHR
jgi:PhnB protein